MGIDIIVTWPVNADYPLWREWVRENRRLFADIYVVFMQTNDGIDYSDFVRDAMRGDAVSFLNSPPVRGGEDWRSVAVNAALGYTRNEWVLFTEQDMLIPSNTTQALFEACFNHYKSEGNKVFTSKQGDRLHPSWLLCERKTVFMTKRDFGIVPGEYDHFWKFYNELQALRIPIMELSYLEQWHMNGLSHNLALMHRGQEAVYKPFEFLDYLKRTLRAGVPIDDNYGRVASDYILQHE